MDWRQRVAAAFGEGRTPDDDVIDELAQHAAALYQSARAEGCAPEEAERRLQDQLSAWSRDATILKHRTRRIPPPEPPIAFPSSSASRTRSASGIWQQAFHDVRYALRRVRRERAHAILVVLTMALGICATTVLFSVTYGVLLKPLPWPEADRLVRVQETRQGGAPRVAGTLSNGTYLAWSDRPTTIESLGGWSASRRTLTGIGDPERILVASATPSLFAILRARPEVGRLFVSGDTANPNIVLLSHGLWRNRFGGRRDVIGRTIHLDGEPYVVVGVTSAAFVFTDPQTRAWTPFAVPQVVGDQGARRMAIFRGLARLRPGVTPAQASAEATARGRGAPDPGLAAVALFGSKGPVDVSVIPALEAMTSDVRPAIRLLLAAGLLLLVTGTANVASVQLARAANRRREFAIRAAIGAGTGRLALQILIESLLLGLAGGVVGLVAARAILQALPALLPADFPRADAIALDAPVLLASVGVSLIAGAACAIVPVLQTRRVNLVEALTEDSLAPIGARMRTATARVRGGIMIGQVAVACVLLVGATLLTRSLVALQRADRGYDPANVLTARMPVPRDYPLERKTQVLEAIVRRLHGIPGVEQAAFANGAPLMSAGGYSAFTMRSPRRPDQEISVEAAQRVVSPEYFRALRLRIADGRPLTVHDDAGSPPVLVVNRSFAERYLGDRPVGMRIPWYGARAGLRFKEEASESEIVGIVEDVRQGAVDAPRQPEIIAAYAQVRPDTIRAFDPILIVRTAGDAERLVPLLREFVREQDPALALDSVMTMDQRIATSLARPRIYALLVAGFAGFAALIVAVGLFGVLAYSVALRVREIGVRTALGATPSEIVSLVLGQAVWVTAVGLVAGLGAAYVTVRWMSTLLYGVGPHDAATFAGVATLLLVIAALASIGPARRAACVDPLSVLR